MNTPIYQQEVCMLPPEDADLEECGKIWSLLNVKLGKISCSPWYADKARVKVYKHKLGI